MLRLLFRLFLIAYGVLPLIAVVLLIMTVRNVQSELTPVYEAAGQNITDATDDLRDELRQLRAGFQPMVNTVNSLRSALSTINNFINNSVNDAIDWIDDFTLGVFDFPRFNGITLPPVVNLQFIDNISDSVDDIGDQVSTLVETTSNTVVTQMEMLTLALIIFGVWVALGPVIMLILVFSGALRV
jgi:archaellum component FlaC